MNVITEANEFEQVTPVDWEVRVAVDMLPEGFVIPKGTYYYQVSKQAFDQNGIIFRQNVATKMYEKHDVVVDNKDDYKFFINEEVTRNIREDTKLNHGDYLYRAAQLGEDADLFEYKGRWSEGNYPWNEIAQSNRTHIKVFYKRERLRDPSIGEAQVARIATGFLGNGFTPDEAVTRAKELLVATYKGMKE